MKARFADLRSATMPMTPAELGKLIADETEKWAKVIRMANLKPARSRVIAFSIATSVTPRMRSGRYIPTMLNAAWAALL